MPARGTKVTLACEWCGALFLQVPSRSSARFCSRECKYAHQARNRVTVVCQQCGKLIKLQRSLAHTRFCSMRCKVEARRVRIVSRCLQCGREIVDNQPRQFCNWYCSGAYKRKRVWKTCPGCGKRFHVYPSLDRVRFCSRECWYHYAGETTIERLMREALTARRVGFRVQYPIGPFTVDFFLPRFAAVIETEGSYWHGLEAAKANDWRRMVLLGRGGYHLFRCAEDDVRRDALALVDDMLTILQKGAKHGRLFEPWRLHQGN